MKIFGTGFIAQYLKKGNLYFNDNYIIYAAGISNSKISDEKDLKRELNQIKNFIKKYNNKKIIIYLSTMSVFDKLLKNNKYIKNKLLIEDLFKKKVKKFIIVRLTQVVGNNQNPSTITNFFYNNIKNNNSFYLWSGQKRNLIDIDDVVKIFKRILKKKFIKSKIINIYNTKSISVKKIIIILSKILNKEVKFKEKKFKKRLGYFSYKKFTKFYQFANLFDKGNYNKRILIKYYK